MKPRTDPGRKAYSRLAKHMCEPKCAMDARPSAIVRDADPFRTGLRAFAAAGSPRVAMDALALGMRIMARDAASPGTPALGLSKIAAGIVYRSPDNCVLLIKRSDKEKNFPGHWALPGGGVNLSETPEEGAIRESKEEIGHAPEGDLHPISKVMTPTGMTFHTFEAKADDKFTPTLNEEHTEHVWAKPDELPSPMHPAVEKLLTGRDPKIDARLNRMQDRRGGAQDADPVRCGMRKLAAFLS